MASVNNRSLEDAFNMLFKNGNDTFLDLKKCHSESLQRIEKSFADFNNEQGNKLSEAVDNINRSIDDSREVAVQITNKLSDGMSSYQAKSSEQFNEILSKLDQFSHVSDQEQVILTLEQLKLLLSTLNNDILWRMDQVDSSVRSIDSRLSDLNGNIADAWRMSGNIRTLPMPLHFFLMLGAGIVGAILTKLF